MRNPVAPLMCVLLVSLLAMVACEDEEAASDCEPRTTQSCTCEGGGMGTQICLVGGSYSDCTCEPDPGDLDGGLDTAEDPVVDVINDVVEDPTSDPTEDMVEDAPPDTTDVSSDVAEDVSGDTGGDVSGDAPGDVAGDAAD